MMFMPRSEGTRAVLLVVGASLLLSITLYLSWEEELSPLAIPRVMPVVRLDVPRSERFPSKEKRVQLYMSNWYAPPCADYADGFVQVEEYQDKDGWPVFGITEMTDVANATRLEMASAVHPDTAFAMDRNTILDCSVREGDPKYAERTVFRSNMYMYCLDVARSLLPAYDHARWEVGKANQTVFPPVLMQFGDLKYSHDFGFVRIPHMKKFRIAANQKALESVTQPSCFNHSRPSVVYDHPVQPIVWKLATRRHYGYLDSVFLKDMPWEKKKNMAVFRGQLTGSRDGYDKHRSDLENCLNLRRCRLVYNHANSPLVNARLTDTRGRLPDVMNGVELTTSSVTIRHLLRYKGIVMLEGNDVASGLKWALLSESIVLMPIPKHTSWAMEELLVPWVHYVPITEDAEDLEEKMQWIVTHDEESRRISHAATLWMQDLVYHPDAAEDDRWIQEETIRRYFRHFKLAK